MTGLAAAYLESALLLALAALALAALLRWGGATVGGAPARWGRIAWLLVGIALVGPWLWRGIGTGGTTAAIEVGRSASLSWLMTAPAAPTPLLDQAARSTPVRSPLLIPRSVLTAATLILALGWALAGARLIRRRRRLARLCASLPVWRRFGRVRLCASDVAVAPFAARADGRVYIVVPTTLCADLPRLRLVIAHEAEHHRRGDLQRALIAQLLRALFFWNPGVALWERALIELEDLACDRGVLRRLRASSSDYARTLIWAAETTRIRPMTLWGARGMAARAAGTLRRRILMLGHESGRKGRMTTVALAGLTVLLVAGSSWAVRGSVGEQKLDEAQVTALAHRIEARSGFPMPIDAHVVEALNRRIATPTGRASTQLALARMASYRAMIEEQLGSHHLPAQLLAVALAESGFDNDVRTSRPAERQSAGIWQFLPGTARHVGLEVSSTRDERLDPRRATDAAAALLDQLHQRFGDWPVAIAAYNGGPATIEALVHDQPPAEARTRLLGSDTEFGRYLASVLACVILTENPELMD